MKRILWFSDGVAKTGFSVVAHNIIKNLDREEYEVHHVAVNYHGDPHDEHWKIYPAHLKGDIWGFGRVGEFVDKKIDGIFILNDPWVISKYLTEIKNAFRDKVPPIVVYFPVDSRFLNPVWFEDYNLVEKICVYTEFGKSEVIKSRPDLANKVEIIQHGVDTSVFYKLDDTKNTLKKRMFPGIENIEDSFIVLSAQRNQPRKRLDITIEAFALFSYNKPENVRLYMHCGMKDAGWDLNEMFHRYGLSKRAIVTNKNLGLQQIPESGLNMIYNSTDVGINTSIGEGWSLTNHEHASTGAPQIVPDHSALYELYKDVGILVPVTGHQINIDNLNMSFTVNPEDVAEAIQKLYVDKELYNRLSRESAEKFSSEKYVWKNIVENHWTPVFNEVFKK